MSRDDEFTRFAPVLGRGLNCSPCEGNCANSNSNPACPREFGVCKDPLTKPSVRDAHY